MRIKFSLVFFIAIPFLLTAQHFGESKHSMNKNTSNMDVLKYWKTNSPKKAEIYQSALNILSASKEASYSDLLLNEKYLELCSKLELHLLGGPILGEIKEHGISIWLRTSIPSKIQVSLSSENKIFTSETSYTKIENDLSGLLKIDGLTDDTTYSYKVIINDSIEVSDDNYFFKTLPNKDEIKTTRIVFGSCLHRWGLGNSQLFSAIKKRKPSAMLLLGDIAVQDRDNHLGMHRADYLLRDFQTAWSDFACNMPIYASWDDHDYFNNDESGVPNGYIDQDRDNVRQIFKNSWNNPSYGLNDEGIYFKSKIGLCEVVMTDNRYFGSEEKSSFLGKKQMEWLKMQIVDCKSPFLILSCGSMWSDFVSNGKDSWGVSDSKGREDIFKLIEDRNISGVLLISGDRHGARGFTIQRESGFEFYEFEVASLGARIGPPKTKPEWTNQLYGIDGTFAFGEFTFKNTTDEKHVDFRLIKEDGNILYKKRLSLNDLTPVE